MDGESWGELKRTGPLLGHATLMQVLLNLSGIFELSQRFHQPNVQIIVLCGRRSLSCWR